MENGQKRVTEMITGLGHLLLAGCISTVTTYSLQFAEEGRQSEVSASPATSRGKASVKFVEYKSTKSDLTMESEYSWSLASSTLHMLQWQRGGYGKTESWVGWTEGWCVCALASYKDPGQVASA